jgi:hypothetical protein
MIRDKISAMRFSILFSFVLFIYSEVSGQPQKGFEWVSPDHQFYKIDQQTGLLRKHSPKQAVSELGHIRNWDQLKEEIPADFSTNCFYHKDSLLVTIPGTGHLYYFQLDSLLLRRLDETYFRGYNFYAQQFIRKDTIFSIGGQGFWNRHSTITYFDNKRKEWELYPSSNNIPDGTTFQFSGYSSEEDAFFSAYLETEGELREKETSLHIYSFKKKKWETKGYLSQEIKNFDKTQLRSLWTGKYLILWSDKEPKKILIADPFNNKLLQHFNSRNAFFIMNCEVYHQNGYLYSLTAHSMGRMNNIQFDSLSLEKIIAQSSPLGKLYASGNYLVAVMIALIIALLIAATYLILRRKKRSAPGSRLQFTEQELLILQKLLRHNKEKKFTTLEINELLQIDKKSYDNQRQIRNRVISSINQQAYNFFNTQLVQRSSNNEDKRMMIYFINPQIKEKDLENFAEQLATTNPGKGLLITVNKMENSA